MFNRFFSENCYFNINDKRIKSILQVYSNNYSYKSCKALSKAMSQHQCLNNNGKNI